MKKLREILACKGSEVWSIEPDRTVYDAIYVLAEKKIGALAVMQGESLIGVVSERDYARSIILKGRSSRSTMVSEIMTAEVITATPEQGTRECMEMMNRYRIRHLPVVEEDGTMIGMISIGDLVRSIIAEQESTIVDLEKYITG